METAWQLKDSLLMYIYGQVDRYHTNGRILTYVCGTAYFLLCKHHCMKMTFFTFSTAFLLLYSLSSLTIGVHWYRSPSHILSIFAIRKYLHESIPKLHTRHSCTIVSWLHPGWLRDTGVYYLLSLPSKSGSLSTSWVAINILMQSMASYSRFVVYHNICSFHLLNICCCLMPF